MKLLICEDNNLSLKVMEHKLKRDGFEVVTASDGKIASSILREQKIDFLITDLHMPYVSGLDLIKLVRDKLKQNIPIIMISIDSFDENILMAFEMGADDYITKPFDSQELSVRVKHQLFKYQK